MVVQIPLWIIISFVSLIVLLFVFGYFWLRKHNRKEN